MNILFFTSSQEPKDGWSVVGYNIVSNLKNCNIEIFSSEDKSKISFGKTKLKSELYKTLKYLGLGFDLINVLINIKNKPDIIHCNVEHYAPLAMYLSYYYKVPYTITAHGTYGVILPLNSGLYKKAFENANKIITVSNYTKRRMIEEKINANYEVIFNGADKKKFIPNKEVKKDIITFVGNLKSRKGLQFLLESMIEVNKYNPNIKLMIIGNIKTGSNRYQEVLNYIKKYNLNVEFSGKVTEEELIKYYQEGKLNILPSQTEPYFFEGFGLIHLEANLCGTLTIGTKNSGNEDAIHKKNGYLIEYGDVKDLTKKIIEVFSLEKYPSIESDMINGWNEVANKYFKVFEEVIEY